MQPPIHDVARSGMLPLSMLISTSQFRSRGEKRRPVRYTSRCSPAPCPLLIGRGRSVVAQLRLLDRVGPVGLRPRRRLERLLVRPEVLRHLLAVRTGHRVVRTRVHRRGRRLITRLARRRPAPPRCRASAPASPCSLMSPPGAPPPPPPAPPPAPGRQGGRGGPRARWG